ncbi:DUF3298 and DUF4163 domain-containing protein [Legionella hackeliae]|uniref:Endo-1,4-beta-xylanase-like protein n=1 Tax=Legionella hackeliae TaxID=449 RepID=A0A0A8UR62_LEGHA|nr:DUF3298 and DUF4163 domain-containing protein [Legionella hackeliae]KTD15272.1 endo-1,4-beta-xylanase-like protein [Legionella hackeliae]CEK11360.1 conserved exported protein of unknown function [Legionella hackeliae]STX48132.1 endo-1,4-beta-xylanase-like protein [Legionella hackeliae]
MQKLISGLVLLTAFAINTVWAESPTTVTLKKESATFDLDLKYPQGFANKNIDNIVKTFIDETQRADFNPDSDAASDAPGKNSLHIDYKLQFQNKNAVSLLFNISVYNRGAAHPNNTVRTFNFIDGKEVLLADLFMPESNYLAAISKISQAAIIEKKISDDNDWITKGTEPTKENYRNWYFTNDGLAIVFDTYQVAAYVYGPQTVTIPKSKLANWLRPEVAKTLWGNQ